MRHLQHDRAAPPSRIAAATGLQRTNYALVRREWATAVAAAVGYDTTNLDAALALLTAMENGLTTSRPQNRAKRTATQN
jgi:hypothetical protein